MKNSAHANFNEKGLDSVGFVKLNSYPAKGEHAKANYNVDQSIDEPPSTRRK